MTAPDRDPGLDTLLELHGQTLFVDEIGHWVKFVVLRTEVTPKRPHGLSYSLTLHAPDGEGAARTGCTAAPGERSPSPAAHGRTIRPQGRGHAA